MVGRRVISQLATHLHLNRPLRKSSLSAPEKALIDKLCAGGDARITLSRETGLNKYLSAPYPRDIIAYSSSTVSDISEDAFAHLIAIEAAADQPSYAQRLSLLAQRIVRAYRIDDQARVVFAPSGTDLEYVALAAVIGKAPGGVHNVLLGADEIGSGCIHSANGRYFAQETALGIAVEPAQPVEGMGPVSLIDIPVRCPTGKALSSGQIAGDMAREIAEAKRAGKHCLVHGVHGSKTGLVLPSLDDLDQLLAEHGDAATFVIDACQARITSDAIARYLDRGCIVLMTGSKFMGAPPFNGWALIPDQLMRDAAPLPDGFAQIFRKAEWPTQWPGAGRLSEDDNLSLALRLEAALFELERFQAIPIERVEAMIAAFEEAVDMHLVGPLGLKRVTPSEAQEGAQCPIEMRTLATLDVSSLPACATFDDAQKVHKDLAMAGVRLGQPVKCVNTANGWGGTLRVGLSMPLLVNWAPLSMDTVRDQISADMQTIAQSLRAAADVQPLNGKRP